MRTPFAQLPMIHQAGGPCGPAGGGRLAGLGCDCSTCPKAATCARSSRPLGFVAAELYPEDQAFNWPVILFGAALVSVLTFTWPHQERRPARPARRATRSYRRSK